MKFNQLLTEESSREVRSWLFSSPPSISLQTKAILQIDGVIRSEVIEVDRGRQEWSIRWEKDGHSSYHTSGVTTTEEMTYPRRVDQSLPSLALKMVFPWKLSIWGREHDDYRPFLIERHMDEQVVVISLRHQSDPLVRGAILFDRKLCIATVLIRPTDTVRLDDIKIGARLEGIPK